MLKFALYFHESFFVKKHGYVVATVIICLSLPIVLNSREFLVMGCVILA